MGLRVAFRVDASARIGLGHLRRCLTLASVLRQSGAECIFVSSSDQTYQPPQRDQCHLSPSARGCLGNLPQREGFEVRPLCGAGDAACDDGSGSPGRAKSTLDWRADVEQTLDRLGSFRVDWLVVDHYGVDRSWEQVARSGCQRIMVIDDLANRYHDCDILLDQSPGRTLAHYQSRLPSGARVLLGPRYALLRPEFGQWRAYSLARRNCVAAKRLLVSFGGADQTDMILRVLEVLSQSPLADGFRDDPRKGLGQGADLTVVVGPLAGSGAQVLAEARRMRLTVQVLTDVDNMAELMAESDLAIGAAGGTAWERCALGLPSLVMVLADNQRFVADALAAHKAALVVPSPEHLAHALRLLCLDDEGRSRMRAMSLAASGLVDGIGASRVCHEMLAYDA